MRRKFGARLPFPKGASKLCDSDHEEDYTTYLEDFMHQLHQSPVVCSQAVVRIEFLLQLRNIGAVISIAREAIHSLESR